jgi:hypothetical protein
MSPARCIPPEGPGSEAMEAFARALERGLHNAYPDYDFVVRRKQPPADEPAPAPSRTPGDGDAVAGD